MVDLTCKTGWWACLTSHDQAQIVTAAIIGSSIILAAIIVAIGRKRGK